MSTAPCGQGATAVLRKRLEHGGTPATGYVCSVRPHPLALPQAFGILDLPISSGWTAHARWKLDFKGTVWPVVIVSLHMPQAGMEMRSGSVPGADAGQELPQTMVRPLPVPLPELVWWGRTPSASSNLPSFVWVWSQVRLSGDTISETP